MRVKMEHAFGLKKCGIMNCYARSVRWIQIISGTFISISCEHIELAKVNSTENDR